MKVIQQLKRPTLEYPRQPTRVEHTKKDGTLDKDAFNMAKFAWKEDYKGVKYQKDKYKLPWSESLSLNIEEILIHPSVRGCVRLSPWDHNGSVKS